MATVRRFLLCLTVSMALIGPPAATAPAPDKGALSHFGLARKDCVGTAAGRTSKVWYTVARGVLSDVYEPTIARPPSTPGPSTCAASR
ncbi:hypothetical protein ACIBHX_29010 [Nonomuraea sp. NPDC050536]|uniref:hypothetical protein n=1 Tax=Nonomuraea sp. NPDC050536 TaxID=3364366 RepID=UPI0037CB3615